MEYSPFLFYSDNIKSDSYNLAMFGKNYKYVDLTRLNKSPKCEYIFCNTQSSYSSYDKNLKKKFFCGKHKTNNGVKKLISNDMCVFKNCRVNASYSLNKKYVLFCKRCSPINAFKPSKNTCSYKYCSEKVYNRVKNVKFCIKHINANNVCCRFIRCFNFPEYGNEIDQIYYCYEHKKPSNILKSKLKDCLTMNETLILEKYFMD